jgi:hypothetical protein
VADALYRDVLSQGYHGLPGSAFTPVEVQVKSYSGKAWIYLPGGSQAPGAGCVQATDSPAPGSGRALVEEFLDSAQDIW